MPDILSFEIICGLGGMFIFCIHATKELREELSIRPPFTLLEEMVFWQTRQFSASSNTGTLYSRQQGQTMGESL